MQRRLRERGRRLSLEQVWKLVNAPVDEDNVELLGTLALAVAGDRAQRPLLQWLLDVNRLRDASLEDAEQAARTASILRWFALQYPDVGGVTLEKAAELEEAAVAPGQREARGRGELDPRSGGASGAARAVRPGSRSASAATAAGGSGA